MVKKLLLASAALALISASPGFAADLPVKAPPMPEPVFTWTGLYFGGNAGWGWSRTVSTELPPGSGAFPIGTVFSADNTSGFLAGVQGGFNYQTAYNLVVGAEGEWTWTNMSGTAAPTISTVPRFAGFSSITTGKTTEIAALTGRIGYAAGNWLFYGKGGVALDHTNSSGLSFNPNGTLFETTSTGTDRSGWVVGAGFEWAFAPAWSAKIEYEHFDFGSTNIAVVGTINTTFVSNTQRIDLVKGGINYRFNWGTPANY